MPADPKPLVLIVEDEEAITSVITEYLEASGMMTQAYDRCSPALRFLQHNFANLLLLDLTLPDQDGFSFLEELKRNNISIPTIFLTGNDSEISKVRGLDMGADDYVTKPFSAAELVARINAVLRRSETSQDHHITRNSKVTDSPFIFAGASIDPTSLQISFPNGDTEKIGRKELGIMAYLKANPGTIITRKSLIHSVWGVHADVRSRSLDQYIVKIRDLFERKDCPLNKLRTIHGIGYEFEMESVSSGVDQTNNPSGHSLDNEPNNQ